RRLPARFELGRRAVTAVEMPGGEELLGAGAVEVGARALEVRPLVPREPEPGEALDDRLDRFGRRALAVRVLDAEHEASAMVARKQVAEEGGAHPTDVEMAGRAGREASKVERPDLIFRDLKMPVMDGWEATKRIREMDGGETIRIIALTAQAMAGDEQKALAIGCDDYLAKPVVDPDLVRQKVERLI